MPLAEPDAPTAYAEAVTSGRELPVPVGALVRSACERHLADLSGGSSRGLRWDGDLASRAIRFFGLLKQSKGRWADQPLELLPWQAFVVGSLFGWQRYRDDHEAWVRRYRHGYVEVAKKNGKTTFAAGIGLWLLDMDGENGAEVYSAATKRDQARLCWDEAAQMVHKTAGLRRRIKVVDSRANMYVTETASKYVALGADKDSADGINPHGGIIDELHRHSDRELVDIIEQSAAARQQPLMFYVTTAGLSGESIYQELHRYARSVVEGTVADDEWFVYLATLDEADDWQDPSVYGKANPSLGVTVQLADLVQERDKALQVPGRQNAFRRLRLNQQTEQAERWIDLGLWDANAGTVDLERLKGRPCYGGLDLSSVSDLSAWVLAFPRDDDREELDIVARCWCPESKLKDPSNRYRDQYAQWARKGFLTATEGEAIDYAIVKADILADAARYRIEDLNVDFLFQGFQLAQELTGAGLKVFGMRQGFMSMAMPMKEFERRLIAHKLHHGGNPILRWAASNVSVRQDPAGNLKPDKSSRAEKIDPVVALVMALDRAMRNSERRRSSVYNTRGLAVI